jgi:hypothetical protein
MLEKALVVLSVVGMACAATVASAKEGVTLSQDKKMVFTMPSGKFTPPLAHRPGTPAIFSNIGTKYPKGEYFCCEGYTISGPTSDIGSTNWLAAAFTPAASATVTEVDVAVGYVTGTNGITIGLYADAGGVPGTLLKSFTVSSLPTFGSCCALAVAKDKAGVPVTAGTQYWITLTTPGKESSTWDAWNLNTTDQVDTATIAVNTGSGWTASLALPAPSFGVYGK